MDYTADSFFRPTEDLRSLQLLEELSRDSGISQRKLSNRLSIALGITNACLKKMIKKGYIKVKGINHKRLSYYITPKGVAEKLRLSYQFMEYTIRYYSNLKDKIMARLGDISRSGCRNIVFYGAGEIMEVAFISLQGSNLKLLGIIDDDPFKQGSIRFGYTIKPASDILTIKPEAIFITTIKHKNAILNRLKKYRLNGIKIFTM